MLVTHGGMHLLLETQIQVTPLVDAGQPVGDGVLVQFGVFDGDGNLVGQGMEDDYVVAGERTVAPVDGLENPEGPLLEDDGYTKNIPGLEAAGLIHTRKE